jgi:predicted ArsR family transcriptional regulator
MTKRKNPETSNEAYRSLKLADIKIIKQKIIAALEEIKEGTFEEIAQQMNVIPDKVWKRLSELAADRRVYRPGNKRPLRSGRMGYTWKILVPGETPQKVTESVMPGPSISDFSKKLTQKDLF